MTLTIFPSQLKGTIAPPPSKSQAHRCLIAAALAGEGSAVRNLGDSEDIQATRRCLTALMAPGQSLPELDCGESGSTLRFLIPLALALRGGGRFTGHGRLMERPQEPYFRIFEEKGIFYEQKNGVLTVKGRLSPGEYRLPGNVSSQFITGLLYALPLLKGDSEIMLTTKLESVGYVNMTRRALEEFGVCSAWKKPGLFDWKKPSALTVPGNQRYQPREVTVEADWSQAGFWYAAQTLEHEVDIIGMNPDSLQGDRVIADYADMIRGKPLLGGVRVPVYQTEKVEALRKEGPVAPPKGAVGSVSLSVAHCPDLVPPLAAMGAFMKGRLLLQDAARLRIKESDRLAAVREELWKLGAKVEEGPDFLDIEGQPTLPGGVDVDAHNDHRIAMMLAIAATRCERPIVLAGAESVSKSYPNFWEDYVNLGGKIGRHPD